MTSERTGLAHYSAAASRWLAQHAGAYRRDQGPSHVEDFEARVREARRFQALLHKAGYAGITVPCEYGGQGLDDDYRRSFEREAAAYRLPTEMLDVSINIVGQTLLEFASDELCRTHLPRILSGEEIWIQMLSEPSGGSDLASLVTRATQEGETFLLNGQKIWSTNAAVADFSLCPARTDWRVPKYHGITVFALDMRSPGIDVRPIRQIDGAAEFYEEYLTDVRVASTAIVGGLNVGWTVVRRLLEIEHEVSGHRTTGRRATGSVRRLVALAEATDSVSDPTVRKAIASIHVQLRAHELLSDRVSRLIARGKATPGYGALLKLSNDEMVQRRAEVGLQLAGLRGIIWPESDLVGDEWARLFLNSRSASIGGGTTEIQKNNFSERVLGLPRELAADHEVPFDKASHN